MTTQTGADLAAKVSAGSEREAAFYGMACVDTSHNSRIPLLMELVGSISRAATPQQVLSVFAKGMSSIRGEQPYISLSTRGLGRGQYRVTRMLLDNDLSKLSTADPWVKPDSIPVHEGGFFGQIIQSAYPELIYNLNIKNDPVVGDALAPYGSMMAIPLFDNGEPLNWSIMLREDPEGFTLDDLEDSILQANLVGGTVRRVQMANELETAHRQIRQEVDRIAAIQRSLLPDRMPDIPGVTLAASYETFDKAGGDYYDFFPLGRGDKDEVANGPWGVLIADVSGHGPAAAVMMAMLHAILHAYPYTPNGPAEVLRHANIHMCRKRVEGAFVTAFFGIYDPQTREFSYARAGHNPPLLKQPGSGGKVTRLDEIGGIPLGVEESVEYEETSIALDPGQSVVLYTDGITEAFDPKHEMFGLDGIENALTTCTGEPDCVVGSVTGALQTHEAGVRPHDDQTLVVMRVNEGS